MFKSYLKAAKLTALFLINLVFIQLFLDALNYNSDASVAVGVIGIVSLIFADLWIVEKILKGGNNSNETVR